MPQEGLLCLFVVFVELNLSVDAGLFPEHRHWAADLHVGETVVVDDDDLLRFAKVGDLAFGVQASGVVTRAAFLEGTACEQEVLDLFACVS